jgi:hypothetical protein
MVDIANIVSTANVKKDTLVNILIPSQHVSRKPKPLNEVLVNIPPVLKVSMHLRV